MSRDHRRQKRHRSGCLHTNADGCVDLGCDGPCLTTLLLSSWTIAKGTARGAAPGSAPAAALRTPTDLALRAIAAYQSEVSARRAAPVCVHRPTCSAYGATAVGRYGMLRGGWLTLRRVGRCRPGRGGWDPVP